MGTQYFVKWERIREEQLLYSEALMDQEGKFLLFETRESALKKAKEVFDKNLAIFR